MEGWTNVARLRFLFICLGSFYLHAISAQTAAVSAPGRIEGTTPTIKMAFSIPGTVSVIYARAGDTRKLGAPLVSLECSDRNASVQLAKAVLKEQKSLLEKARVGARVEERAVVAEKVKVVRAELDALQTKYSRAQQLKQKGNFLSDAEVDAAKDAVRLASAKLATSEAELRLTNAPTRTEELQAMNARVSAEQARVSQLQAEADKCVIRAPADVTVLRNFVEVGDAFIPGTMPAVISVANLSTRRVRAEVDERDVRRIRIGQTVSIISEYNSSLKLSGKVVRIEGAMGRRSIKSSDPSEKNDRDVLEVIVDVNRPPEGLPIGLRVVVVFSAT
jgi:HlyD family secretion protein